MKIYLVTGILLLTLFCFATSTTMSFTEGSFVSLGKTLRLSLSDENGQKEDIDYLSAANAEPLYFIADPITKDEFSKKDIVLVRDLKIVQKDKEIGSENKITAAFVNHPAWKLYFIYANIWKRGASILLTPIIVSVLRVCNNR